ncbi:MAG: DUF2911 domain-containing protein [Candidatus Aminicenantes bacterium]|nr:DUF2911 domain-containing protein [Candidatus Aminicenantes bacterium]
MKKIGLVLVVLVSFLLVLPAQDVKFPRVSQGASVTQTIGLCDVTIKYHRPGVKGRQVWGELVPFDKVWRAGANEATTISFGCDVKVEGKDLKAGTYGFFMIPKQDNTATLIFSKQADIWGTYGYKEENDVLRIDVKTEKAKTCEWMVFYFVDLSDSAATGVLHWENVKWQFKIEVDTKGTVIGSAKKALGRYWRTPFMSARYAYEEGIKLEEALKWVEMSTAIETNFFNMELKAKILKKMAKTKKDHKTALKLLEKAIMLGKKLSARQQEYYLPKSKELLETWKKGK